MKIRSIVKLRTAGVVVLLGVVLGALRGAAATAVVLPYKQTSPVTQCFVGQRLQQARQRILADDPMATGKVAQLRQKADRFMQLGMQAVTDKLFPAPSGDKHDYVSLSKYFWPNPKTSDGLPYVLLDGETNPENRQYDASRLGSMIEAVKPKNGD